MTTLDIARKDFADAVRSRALWFATAVFATLMCLSAALPSFAFDDPGPDVGVAFIQGPAVAVALPIIAIMLGYRSVVGERERGSVKFLLALPHSRLDVIAGKLLGRSAVLAVAIAVGFLVTGGLIAVLYGVPSVGALLLYALLTALAGTTYVAISVSVSAIAGSATRAIAALVGGYVTAAILWERILALVHYLSVGEAPGGDRPWWLQLATSLNPIEAHSAASTAILPETPHVHFEVSDSGLDAQQGQTVVTPESAYVFGETWFVVGVLLAWILVAAVAGYLRFRTVDLT